MEISLYKGCTHKQQFITVGSFEPALAKKMKGQSVMQVITHSGQGERVCVSKSGGYDEAVFLLE